MAIILITGGSGFLGQALTEKLLRKGNQIYSLSRHPPYSMKNLTPLVGDITQPDLGLEVVPDDVEAVYHLAAIHQLSENRAEQMWQTNVEGTKNVIDFCLEHKIPKLYFTSTAYTQGRNTYERSKAICDLMVTDSKIPEVIIFKPSIVLGTEQHFYPGHFAQFIALVIKLHKRAELIRRKIEGTLRLPIIEPVFRIRGNPDSQLNLVLIDTVAQAMASTDKPGTYRLTNPNPPTLAELADWIGRFIMIKMKVEPYFKATPVEATFEKMSKAFMPYLLGGNLPSDLKNCPPVTEEIIDNTIVKTLLG